MTRKKKTRTGGPLAAAKKQRQGESVNPSASKKVGKGKASGSRHSGPAQQSAASPTAARDKRTGSKKPISLTPAAKPAAPVKKSSAATEWPPQSEKAMLAALQTFEQDAQFMAQLDTLEQGGVLAQDQQQAFSQKLERYDWLLEQLDPSDDDEDWDDLSEQGKSLKDEWL
ncbi:Der GTPase-activating protein YihI [Neiella marina]|uniref:Der GTPase-activating protein YihI n=1 Tax=Neiella marina TaxID=508461 RepID=A0A8J2U1N5_9GAMM|nr:GTPase-activating protein [Neiella marina]GGA63388.1 Der GTPase-activating protein YihI [Neiella marina]